MAHNLTKQPSEKKVYEFPAFALPAGVTLASIQSVNITARGHAVEVLPLLHSNAVFSGAVVQMTLEGGTDDEEYLITVVAVDSLGEIWEEDVELRVVDFTWAIPDGTGHIYLTPADYITRFGYDETLLLTDTHDVGRIDKDRLGALLVEATALVDGYVGRRYPTPLSPVPETVKGIVADLCRFLLHGVSVPDAVDARQRQALSRLKDISSGVMTLSIPEVTSSASGGGPDFVSPTRVFNRDTLKGF